MAESTQELKKTLPLIKISGVYFIPPHLKEESILETINFKPNPGDIFLVTYPKAGTTWTQYIIWKILNKARFNPEIIDMMKDFPYLEFSGTKLTEHLPKPRMMKTHLPFKQNPYHPEAKYIYIARNIKDVCVSYYHFLKLISSEFKDITLNDFFEMYLEGKVGYGGWYDHVHSWCVHKDDPNVLILTYEWMKENHREAVLKIASFLGKQYKDDLDNDPSLLETIVEDTTFQSMKKIPMNFEEEVKTEKKESDCNNTNTDVTKENKHDFSSFFRKGEVGDWKNHLSKDQEKRLNEILLAQSEIDSVMTLWDNLWTVDDLHDN